MPAEPTLSARVANAPVHRFHGELVRCVALMPLTQGGVPDYLFTSGRPNRYNPAGIACIYFSEDEQTARAEYARRLGKVARQPLGTYFAEANLVKVLDLAEERTLNALGLKPRDLSVNWQMARMSTKTQDLGLDKVSVSRMVAENLMGIKACGNPLNFGFGVDASHRLCHQCGKDASCKYPPV